jgi:hypothetical protein
VRQRNIADTTIQGLQVGGACRRDFAASELELSADLSYIDEFTYRLLPGTPTIERVGQLFSPPELRARVGGRWTRGKFSSSLYWNFTDSYTDRTVAAKPLPVKAWNTFDGSLAYDLDGISGAIGKNSHVTLSVTNLLDADPPYVASTSTNFGGNWDGSNASIIGRFASLQLVKAW